MFERSFFFLVGVLIRCTDNNFFDRSNTKISAGVDERQGSNPSSCQESFAGGITVLNLILFENKRNIYSSFRFYCLLLYSSDVLVLAI